MIEEITKDNSTGIQYDFIKEDYNVFNKVLDVSDTDCLSLGSDLITFPSYYASLENDTASDFCPEQKKEDAESLELFIPSSYKRIYFSKFLFISDFESQVQLKYNKSSLEESLDYVYDTLDDLLLEGKFDLVNSLLERINIYKLQVDILIGILTITSIWKDKLVLREVFYKKVEIYIYNIFQAKEAFAILEGLE